MTPADRLARWVLTFGGSGTSPVAPGTCGSLAAVAVGALLNETLALPYLFPVLAIGASILTVYLGSRIKEIFGVEDPGAVVLDEAAGQWLALSFLPLVGGGVVAYLWAFLLFRFFDVVKPLGIRKLEKYPGGWGVLLDDLAAGIMAGLVHWGGWALLEPGIAAW